MSSQKKRKGQPLHNIFLCKFKNLTTPALPMLRARSNISFLELPTVDGLMFILYIYMYSERKNP